MAKGKVYISSYPNNPPDWYWVHGLHDACIVNVEFYEFPFDYNEFAKNKNSYERNLMVLRIDSSGALYDQTVKEIKLFNYKILSDNIALQGRKKIWWLADRLTEKEGNYYLEIDLQDFDSIPEDFTLEIKFDRAEVIR